MFLTNGWGSHSNGLFLANGWPSRSNGWHKRLVNGKPFENGKSLVYVFPYKVTNIKSLIMDSPFSWTVPSWIIPHLSKEVEEGFALHHARSLSYLSLRLSKLYAFVLATFTSLRFEEQRTLLSFGPCLASCFKKTRNSKLKEELKRRIK